jgi:hypothetical protein
MTIRSFHCSFAAGAHALRFFFSVGEMSLLYQQKAKQENGYQ